MRSKRNRPKSRRKRGRGANKKIVRKRKTERGRRRAAQRRARVPPFAPVSFTKEQPPSTATQQLSPEEQRFEVYQRGFANPFPARTWRPQPFVRGWTEEAAEAAAAEATAANNAELYKLMLRGLHDTVVDGVNDGAEARRELTERLRGAGVTLPGADGEYATIAPDSDSSSDDGDGPNRILTIEDVKMLLRAYGQRGRTSSQGIAASNLPKMLSSRHGSEFLAKKRGGSRRRHKRRRKTRRRRRSRRRRRGGKSPPPGFKSKSKAVYPPVPPKTHATRSQTKRAQEAAQDFSGLSGMQIAMAKARRKRFQRMANSKKQEDRGAAGGRRRSRRR